MQDTASLPAFQVDDFSALDLMMCPACASETTKLVRRNDSLLCPCCGAEYHYRNGIPVMIPVNRSEGWVEDARQYARMLDAYYAQRIAQGDGWWLPAKDPHDQLGREYGLKAGRWLVTEALARLNNEGVILGVGSGDGYVLTNLLQRNPRLRGIALDLSNVIQDYGSKRHHRHDLHYVTGTIEKIPVAPNSIDGAFATEVIEHVKNVPAFLGSLWKVLKRDAYCCITTPNRRGLAFWWDGRGRHYVSNLVKQAVGKKNLYVFEHPYGLVDTEEGYECILSPKELRAMLRDAGFRIERTLATQWLGESILGYLRVLKAPVSIARAMTDVFISLERRLGSIPPAFQIGFTQVVIARKK